MIASMSVYPVGEGVSLGRFVKKGVEVIKESGHAFQVGPMSTSVEIPDLDSLEHPYPMKKTISPARQ